jgi:hypothetical protein
MDLMFMPFFRFPDEPVTGYFLGTFLLSIACVILGWFSMSMAFLFNREKIENDNRDIEHYQSLSIEALKTGDKTAYKACNSIANNAYGKNFFLQIALSASSLWPVFIALGWMQYRFEGTEISILGSSVTVGYVATFITCYIIVRLSAGKIKEMIHSV